jgi:N-acylneuraminate cytidylyltransferase
MTSNLALIPARGGSKGIQGKNIKAIAGKPLIAWTIEAALEANSIDRVIVSTDSEDIAKVAVEFGAEVPFMRPDSLSSDTSTTESSMIHALDWLRLNESYSPSNIVLLQATSPVRGFGSIDGAFRCFNDENADSLLSLTEFWHFLWKGEARLEALYDFDNRPRRQEICRDDIKYKENGSIYITKCEVLVKSKNRLGGKISSYIMGDEEGYEIDTPLDFAIVESILNFRSMDI